MDNIHLWIIPVVLIGMKILFDLLPKPVFFALLALLVGAYFLKQKMEASRNERAAKQLEETADTFLDEIDSENKTKKEKEAKKKALREQQQKERLRAEEKQKVIYMMSYLSIPILVCVNYFCLSVL